MHNYILSLNIWFNFCEQNAQRKLNTIYLYTLEYFSLLEISSKVSITL